MGGYNLVYKTTGKSMITGTSSFLFLAVSVLSCRMWNLCLTRGLSHVGLLQAPERQGSAVVVHELSCPRACRALVP